MAWSKTEMICRKHPNQNPQPGICPGCLRERLSEIAGNYSRLVGSYNIDHCSSSSFPDSPGLHHHRCYSNSASSSDGGASPRGRHQRVVSDVMESIYWAMSGKRSSGLKKSRSMANYGWRNGDDDNGGRGKKKGGFWNKLLLLRSTRKKSNKF